MESYIPISTINDFTYCPMSLYLHRLYADFHTSLYHEKAQTEGKINHEGIDQGKYSTSAHILQGMEVYSEQWGIMGKIDIYDEKKKMLVERKTKIKKLWQGYIWQICAQYFCLKEMGYCVENLFLHSLKDNKRYPVPLPTKYDEWRFEMLLDEMRKFDIRAFAKHECPKCAGSIYGGLAW